jgi:hypothetical protein
MSAFSYLPDLEKQLIENYEGAVSTHFAVHVSPLLQLGGVSLGRGTKSGHHFLIAGTRNKNEL